MTAEINQSQRNSENQVEPNHRGLMVLLIAMSAIFLLLILGGYIFNWSWTGFRGNTLWDWLKLLVLPVVLTVGGIWFNMQQNRASREVALRQHQTDLHIADNNQQEAALGTYLEHLATLLLEKQLKESSPESDVREVARVRTLTAVWRVGKYRKGVLLKFLYEAGLIERDRTVIDLTGADLSHADLHGAYLRGANLHGANLSYADLHETDLSMADLREANLEGAILISTSLEGADLSGACGIHSALNIPTEQTGPI